jgi:hypothetical protein
MSGLGPDFSKSFATETWVLYGVGILGTVLRLLVPYLENAMRRFVSSILTSLS